MLWAFAVTVRLLTPVALAMAIAVCVIVFGSISDGRLQARIANSIETSPRIRATRRVIGFSIATYCFAVLLYQKRGPFWRFLAIMRTCSIRFPMPTIYILSLN